MRAWVYKVNSGRAGACHGWHFNRYFRTRRRVEYPMGGRDTIRSPQSWARLRKVQQGDLFLCYQADERKLYGFARTAGGGYESVPGSGIFDSVAFEARGLRFSMPVPVAHESTRDVFRHVGAFAVPSRGTIHLLRSDELDAIVNMIVKFNPGQRAAVKNFVYRGL